MFGNVGALCAEIFAYFSKSKREGDDLTVDRQIEFLLSSIKVMDGHEIILYFSFNCHFLKKEGNEISLEDHEFTL